MATLQYDENGRVLFTKEMKEEYSVLIPGMAPYQFEYFEHILRSEGYKADLLRNTGKKPMELGMAYLNNDICIPAILIVGQFLDAIINGGYDHTKVAVIITQTGGGCIASNYISLIRKAFKTAGYAHVPIISFNIVGLEKNPGFSITPNMILKFITGLTMGDMLMQLYNETAPYEINRGETESVYQEVNHAISDYFNSPIWKSFLHPQKQFEYVVKRFSQIPVDKSIPKPKVAIVGEVYVQYSPLGNNNLEQILRDEGCEVEVPGFLNFFYYVVDSMIHDIEKYGGNGFIIPFCRLLGHYVDARRRRILKLLKKYGFSDFPNYWKLKKHSDTFLNQGMHVGEGWLLTAEMVEYIQQGTKNIICTQPFGCLPNHIAGKGMMKKIKSHYPDTNIVAIDYDTSATEINQRNRIKLVVNNAKRAMDTRRGF